MLYQDSNFNVRQYTEIDAINGFIPIEFIELTEAQTIAYNNKPDFGTWNGNEWIEDKEECEKYRIQQIESKCNQAIETVYPFKHKQINITNLLTPYTEQDREDMRAFIDNKRAICHKAIADGTKAEDVDFSNES